MKLDNARILLTGGSLGIGRETAKVLVASGARVVITGRDAGRLRKAAESTGAFAVVADVADPDDIERTYQQAMEHLGGLDCLINNAGIGTFQELPEVTLAEFEKTFRVNVYGAALMAARAVKVFKQQRSRGNIVNIGSTASLKGFAGGTVYGASKFALRGMTECWQQELRKHNIRVMLINPSEVATAFFDGKEYEAAPNKLSTAEIAHAIKSVLELDDRGMIPELAIWATNPW